VVEVAIGMAGFAGIVAAIRHRDIASWAGEDRILLRMLLVASGMSISFAMLPAILDDAGFTESSVWRIGSVSLLVWQIGIAVHRSRQFRALGANPLPRLIFLWVAGILVLQALNIVLGTAWPYLLGIYGLLVNAFAFFMILLLGRSRDGRGAAVGDPAAEIERTA